MAGGVDAGTEATSRALLAAAYFHIPEDPCPTCKGGKKSCRKYFCIPCKVGGVCGAMFQEGGDHAIHAHVRIRALPKKKSTICSHAVLEGDLRKFMTDDMVDKIQLHKNNDRLHCRFFPSGKHSASTAASSSTRPVCCCCSLSLSANSTPNQSATPVCSIYCLLEWMAAQRGKRKRRRKQDKSSIVRSQR